MRISRRGDGGWATDCDGGTVPTNAAAATASDVANDFQKKTQFLAITAHGEKLLMFLRTFLLRYFDQRETIFQRAEPVFGLPRTDDTQESFGRGERRRGIPLKSRGR